MDIEQAKIKLLKQKHELEQRIARTHKHTYQRQNPVSANFKEQVKETENDQIIQNLEAEGLYELEKINQALERIRMGTYLQCKLCGEDIAMRRLSSIPFADKCIKCASTN